jgi:hypothetical protein
MNRVLDGSEIHGAGRWRWPFLVAITVLLLWGGLAVLQYTRFADAATQVEHTEAGDRQRVRRMDGAVAGVPAAALTALARVEDRKRALMAGYQTHLAKPVDPAELVAKGSPASPGAPAVRWRSRRWVR